MERKKYQPDKNRRDIGAVVTLMEKMNAARELSSCCVGTEALLDSNRGLDGFIQRNRARIKTGQGV